MVNFVVGIWWTVTLFVSLILVRRIPYYDQKPVDAERLLIEDHASPAGYRIPSLPDYEIDPALARLGSPCVSINLEFAFGLLMMAFVGGSLIFLSFTEWDESVISQVQRWMSN